MVGLHGRPSLTKYLPDAHWRNLPVHDYRARFFVECYREKLSLYSPHFAQARLMNVFSTLIEIESYLEEITDDDRYKSYINSSLQELDHCVASDEIAKSLIEVHEPIRMTLHKKIQGGDFGRQTLSQLSLYARHGIRQRRKYSEILDEQLKIAVCGESELEKKDRNLSAINALTGRFITDLLSRGYSPTHLYNRAEMFTRLNNYGKRNFREQYDHIIGRIRTGKSKYEVVYGVEVHSAEAILPYLNSGKSTASTELDPRFETAREKLLRSSNPSIFVITEIETTDHVSAAWRAKEHIESQLDYALTLEKNPQCKTSKHAAIGWTNSAGFVLENINISLLQQFLTSEGGAYFGGQGVNFRKIEGSLDIMGKEQLIQCFRHIRLSKESEFLEEKLLNMWIALESLYSFGRGSIIDNIVRYVPRTYAVFSLARRVQYAKKLLIDNSIEMTPFIGAGAFSDTTPLADVFDALHIEHKSRELFESLGEKEHLKFIILRYHETFKTCSSIRARVKASASDVERQLKRVYVTRNKIAHTGYYGNVRPQLITNLYDYTINSLHALYLASLIERKQKTSLEESFNAFAVALDLIDHQLSLNDSSPSFSTITPNVTL